MGIKTGIEWCDSTLNLQMGCDGCELWNPKLGIRRCYAGKLTARHEGKNGWPATFEQPRIFPERLEAALKWPDLMGTKRPDKPWLDGMPRMIFPNDMGDTWTESLELMWLSPMVPFLAGTPHIYIFLTKRPARAVQFWRRYVGRIPLNFWFLTSVTGPENVGRIRELLKLRALGARVLGVSYEPAWGPVDFSPWTEEGLECPSCGWLGREDQATRVDEPIEDWHFDCPECGETCAHMPLDEVLGEGINWIISGGESGAGARQSHPDWFRATRDACFDAGVPFFFKQWGGWGWPPTLGDRRGGPYHHFDDGVTMERVGKKAAGALLDGREWRQMPAVKTLGLKTIGGQTT